MWPQFVFHIRIKNVLASWWNEDEKKLRWTPFWDSAKEDAQISTKNWICEQARPKQQSNGERTKCFKDCLAKTQILRHLHAWLLVLISNYQASQKSSTQKMMKCNSMHMYDWVKWTYFPARRASAPVAIVEKSYFCYKFRDNGRSVGRMNLQQRNSFLISSNTLTAVFSVFHNSAVENPVFLGIIGVDG